MDRYLRLKRFFDLFLVFTTAPITVLVSIFVALSIKMTSKGPILYWSKRVGINNTIFIMPKFRTMVVAAPQVATHLLKDSGGYLISIGAILRKTSLDEIPQLWSVFKGDMSLVGPRPALYNQDDLIALRTDCEVSKLLPGMTGWAQINGRDSISLQEKVKLDIYYLENRALSLDIEIIVKTFFNVLFGTDISH